MNVRSLAVRKTAVGASLVLCGLMAGGTLASVGTASAATSGSGAATSTATTRNAPSGDTAVTGSEADKVVAAVKAKHSTVTITTVRKDPDGSYDALGTDSSGGKVFYDVSADLATVTAGGGGHGGRGHGGPGGAQDTPATASETSSVKAAVAEKDATATITTVRKDPDGSFDALGTSASGSKVFYDVSADYATVTAH